MKTSLLLVGLVMGAGMLGTAPAANATSRASAALSNAHSQALAAASMSDTSVLSTLTELLSGKAKKQTTTPPCPRDPHATTDNKAPAPCQPQRTPPATVLSAHRRAPADGSMGSMDSNAPRSTDSDNPAPSPASSSVDPTLGWQSLLPGSIQ